MTDADEVATSRTPEVRALGGCGEPLFLTEPGQDVCVLLPHADDDHLDMGELEFLDAEEIVALHAESPLCVPAVRKYADEQDIDPLVVTSLTLAAVRAILAEWQEAEDEDRMGVHVLDLVVRAWDVVVRGTPEW